MEFLVDIGESEDLVNLMEEAKRDAIDRIRQDFSDGLYRTIRGSQAFKDARERVAVAWTEKVESLSQGDLEKLVDNIGWPS